MERYTSVILKKRREECFEKQLRPDFEGTVFEHNNITHCKNCEKELKRGVDIDIMCFPCWDYTLIIDEDADPDELEMKKIAKEYVDSIKFCTNIHQKNTLVLAYYKDFIKIANKYSKTKEEDTKKDYIDYVTNNYEKIMKDPKGTRCLDCYTTFTVKDNTLINSKNGKIHPINREEDTVDKFETLVCPICSNDAMVALSDDITENEMLHWHKTKF